MKIIDEAFQLYMPQVRSEITQLTDFIQKDILDKRETDPFYQYNILEIGTKFGGTFYLWNKLNELTNGMNVSIDLADGIHGGVNLESINKRNLYFYEQFNNCHFIEGDSHDIETKNKVTELLKGQQINFLFIDGDHTFSGIKQDFYDYLPFCKSQSFVVFHDIVISDHHHSRDVYVGEFWNEIKNEYNHWEFIELGNNWAGIGILQLP